MSFFLISLTFYLLSFQAFANAALRPFLRISGGYNPPLFVSFFYYR